MTTLVGRTIAHYEILEILGGGGMGVVYKARDLRLDRLVALKFLPPSLTSDPDAKQRFIHEAKTASGLDHQNICVIHDILETGEGQMFIVMAYYEGESLKSRIERGPVSVDEAVFFASQIAQGLAKAHRHGIIHRDIKPANVMITPDGAVKIVDFGLAKLSGGSRVSQAGNTAGTLSYMAPEQVSGKDADQRADVWALGAVLYEMLAGRPAFGGEYGAAIMYMILEQEPEDLTVIRPDLPPHVSTVVRRAMAKDPAARYQSVEDFSADLTSFAGSGAGTEKRPSRSLLRRSPLRIALLTAALCLVAWLVVVQFGPGARRPHVRSLAVLPFRTTSPHLEDTVFADGMTEALNTELSKISALVVRSSRSAMRFRNSDKPLPTIAAELNVDALVDGSIQLSGRSVRVSATLVRANPEQQLWGESYHQDLDDINVLQDKVSQSIVRAINAVVTPEEQSRLRLATSVNAEAYQACTYGRYYLNLWTPRGFQKSLESFRRAATLDSAYAPAYAGIADVYATLWFNGLAPFDSVGPHWRIAAQKAVLHDPQTAEGHVSLAATRIVYDWDWDGAEKEFLKALELNPNYATGHHWYALLLSAQARYDAAAAEIRKALELDPLSVITRVSAGWIQIHARNYDQAIRRFGEALELDSMSAAAHSGLGEIFEMQGRNDEALREYLSVARVTGGSFATLGVRGTDPSERLQTAYRRSGWKGYWTEQLGQLEALSRTTYVSAFHLASVCARLKKTDDAFRWLGRAYEERSTNLLFLTVDPNLQNIRNDPRYAALGKQIGLTAR